MKKQSLGNDKVKTQIKQRHNNDKTKFKNDKQMIIQ